MYSNLYRHLHEVNFNQLVGKTLHEVIVSEDKATIKFITDAGETFFMYHNQDCCEGVKVEDICGDLGNLIGLPILTASEVTNKEKPEADREDRDGFYDVTCTWTFYTLATNRGSVTIRWYGSSNGAYSERVSFANITEDENGAKGRRG